MNAYAHDVSFLLPNGLAAATGMAILPLKYRVFLAKQCILSAAEPLSAGVGIIILDQIKQMGELILS